MADDKHYSLARAKRSLLHFGVGKAASAAFGLVVLVLTVRLLPAKDYGIYVALIASLEIHYILTGFGLSTVAQRYVAEFRVLTPPAHFRQFIARIVLLRLLFALLAAVAVLLVAQPLLALLTIDLTDTTRWLFVLLLVSGSCTRYLDEVLPALLLQAYTQGLLLLSNVVKVLVLGRVSWAGQGFGYEEMLRLELAISILVCLVGVLLLWRYLRVAPTAAGQAPNHENPRMWPVAVRFYLVQVLGQVYGANAVKLMLSNILGLTQTAAFGFFQSLADMIRNYLPAYLLATWVRPLMVSRYVQSRDLGEISIMANVVFKLSLMGVAPFAAFFAIHGDAFSAWVSSGKYVEAAAVLTALTVLIALQSLHVVVGMVTTTLERAGGNVAATVVCCVALPLAVWLARYWGLVGVVAAMALAECLWVGIVWALLARDGLKLALDLRGAAKIIAAAVLAALVIRAAAGLVAAGWAMLLVLALAGVLVLVITALLKPFGDGERAIVGKLMPARFIVW